MGDVKYVKNKSVHNCWFVNHKSFYCIVITLQTFLKSHSSYKYWTKIYNVLILLNDENWKQKCWWTSFEGFSRVNTWNIFF